MQDSVEFLTLSHDDTSSFVFQKEYFDLLSFIYEIMWLLSWEHLWDQDKNMKRHHVLSKNNVDKTNILKICSRLN